MSTGLSKCAHKTKELFQLHIYRLIRTENKENICKICRETIIVIFGVHTIPAGVYNQRITHRVCEVKIRLMYFTDTYIELEKQSNALVQKCRNN